MKTVKQILQKNSYSSDTNSIVSGLSQLAECGLFDEAKLPLIKRGLMKTNVNEMTEAEKKSLQYFIENLMTHVLVEQQDYLSKLDPKSKMNYPSEKDMPSVIVLKRKAIRVYPDNQKVALYYSQALDKYVSIPFGPSAKNLGNHLTMNEEVLNEISQEKAQQAYIARKQHTNALKDDETLTPEEKAKKYSELFKDRKDKLLFFSDIRLATTDEAVMKDQENSFNVAYYAPNTNNLEILDNLSTHNKTLYNYVRYMAIEHNVDLKNLSEPESINLIPVFEIMF